MTSAEHSPRALKVRSIGILLGLGLLAYAWTASGSASGQNPANPKIQNADPAQDPFGGDFPGKKGKKGFAGDPAQDPFGGDFQGKKGKKGFDPNGPGFGPGPAPVIEERLTQLERKLDLLLWELQGIRQEISQINKGGPFPDPNQGPAFGKGGGKGGKGKGKGGGFDGEFPADPANGKFGKGKGGFGGGFESNDPAPGIFGNAGKSKAFGGN